MTSNSFIPQKIMAGTFAFLAVMLASSLIADDARAQAFPERPVHIVLGFAPGGGADILGRAVAQKLSERLKTAVPFENRAGANSMIAAGFVARAKPDGYTLLLITTSHILSAASGQELPFDPISDFAPIAQLASFPNVLAINSKVPAASLREFLELLKANPGTFNFASTGVGGGTHMAAEAFMQAANSRMVHVPYQGAGPAITALRAGEVSAYFGTVASVKPFVQSGAFKVLGVMADKRSPALPQIPTMKEAGVDVLSDGIYGLLAPAKTPDDIVMKLNTEVGAIMKLPDISARLLADGATPVSSSPSDFRAYLTRQVEQLRPLVKGENLSAK